MINKAKKLSNEQGRLFLRDALIDVEQQFLNDLKRKQRSVTHNGELGNAVEDRWIALLRAYLPTRYRVAKAFAIDHLGNTTDQLDCLIYDAHFTPALFGEDSHLYVPAEAVYATFEIKQEVNAQFLKQAAEKLVSLRMLQRTSAPIPWIAGINRPRQPFPIIGGLLAMKTSWSDGLGTSFQKQFSRWRDDY